MVNTVDSVVSMVKMVRMVGVGGQGENLVKVEKMVGEAMKVVFVVVVDFLVKLEEHSERNELFLKMTIVKYHCCIFLEFLSCLLSATH